MSIFANRKPGSELDVKVIVSPGGAAALKAADWLVGDGEVMTARIQEATQAQGDGV